MLAPVVARRGRARYRRKAVGMDGDQRAAGRRYARSPAGGSLGTSSCRSQHRLPRSSARRSRSFVTSTCNARDVSVAFTTLTDVNTTRTLDVLIASPGDAGPERQAVLTAVLRWNGMLSSRYGVTLQPRMWEIDSVPVAGQGGPQEVINTQIVDDCVIVFAIFKHRLGTPTPLYASGTVEEVIRSLENDRVVHLYFSSETPPADADPDQISAVADLREQFKSNALLGSFMNSDQLQMQVIQALTRDLREVATSTSSERVFIAGHARGNLIEDVELSRGMGLIGGHAENNIIRRLKNAGT